MLPDIRPRLPSNIKIHGVRNIDVGCFQISLLHHPQAFASLDEAFDPISNARYAARFLRTLYRQTGNWQDAVALYHSASADRGPRYRDRVLAEWREDRSLSLVAHYASPIPVWTPGASLAQQISASASTGAMSALPRIQIPNSSISQ